ncbi:MAG: isoprenylcysteine carboxylmethyltransferase family protein [Alphaproteobacteria bacterium]|nr:isoprenylcysteine carboxylmethyltransferase family protein [Alphaproteobacteria bacterium]
MNEGILVLYLLNWGWLISLPFIFFKGEGRFNFMWWVTASPFALMGATLITAYLEFFPPLFSHVSLELLSIPISVASISLMLYTLGTHQTPLALWHQKDDAPDSIVTYGAYKKIRHPFYTSFLLMLIGAVIYCPHIGTLMALALGFAILNYTAAKEEKELSASEFGEEYQNYMRTTGRFFPGA